MRRSAAGPPAPPHRYVDQGVNTQHPKPGAALQAHAHSRSFWWNTPRRVVIVSWHVVLDGRQCNAPRRMPGGRLLSRFKLRSTQTDAANARTFAIRVSTARQSLRRLERTSAWERTRGCMTSSLKHVSSLVTGRRERRWCSSSCSFTASCAECVRVCVRPQPFDRHAHARSRRRTLRTRP